MEDLDLINQTTQTSGEDAEGSSLFDGLIDPGFEEFGFDSDE
jgi:hypothetical protein